MSRPETVWEGQQIGLTMPDDMATGNARDDTGKLGRAPVTNAARRAAMLEEMRQAAALRDLGYTGAIEPAPADWRGLGLIRGSQPDAYSGQKFASSRMMAGAAKGSTFLFGGVK